MWNCVLIVHENEIKREALISLQDVKLKKTRNVHILVLNLTECV